MGSSNFRETLITAITTEDFPSLRKLVLLDVYNDGRILNLVISLDSISSLIFLLDDCSKH